MKKLLFIIIVLNISFQINAHIISMPNAKLAFSLNEGLIANKYLVDGVFNNVNLKKNEASFNIKPFNYESHSIQNNVNVSHTSVFFINYNNNNSPKNIASSVNLYYNSSLLIKENINGLKLSLNPTVEIFNFKMVQPIKLHLLDKIGSIFTQIILIKPVVFKLTFLSI